MVNIFEESLLGNTVGEEKAMKSSCGEGGVLIEFNKGGCERHDEKDDSSSKSPDRKDIAIIKEEPLLSTPERSYMETNSKDNSPVQKNQEDQLIKSAKAKMGEVREENERLKVLLAQILKNYKSLQTHFFDVLQEGAAKKSINTAPSSTSQENEETELVSLSLGRTSSEPKKDEKKYSDLSNDKESKGGLELELDCKFEPSSTEPVKNSSSESSFEDLKEEEPAKIWPPSKVLKTMRSRDEDVLQETPLKKARVSVRARCDAHTMNDGCQWRKYGQKLAKGNPCPRAYYRCTVSPSCPVRKQVQRCVEDMSILITTYEGTHNHPLPMSATAMASTTSAAASMLLSQSSSSQPGLSLTAPNSTSTTASLQGLNFTLSQNTRPQQFYFPNPSISTFNSHPTITLDLTAPTTSSPFNRFSYASSSSSTCLNFSSSSTSPLESNTLQTSWNSGHPNYGILSYNNRNHTIESLNLGRQSPQEQIYQPHMPMNNQISSQQSLKETIAAATKVITSDPNFKSALVAALTSFVGNGSGRARENHGGVESSGLSLTRGESFPVNSACPITQNGVACASTYSNNSSAMNFHHHQQQQQQQQQEGSLILFPTSFPLSTSESASGSPTENRNHIK